MEAERQGSELSAPDPAEPVDRHPVDALESRRVLSEAARQHDDLILAV